ncbi:AHL_G0029030.mRNA.1.CDS.1 [Saccharomyces cerevisiae]|nr:AIE_G0029010.mRNA.1.CDS.1 [Saccharomyces cerevisiae]CAI4564376.1 AVB_G0029310.mRNA.1.CDS.1 [Saccharomyces cerevisiae]CAI4886846.1 AHL_G0029030.mRNA.1.CDS.1 [Saccharomyces cerevisiae]CAI6732827.1 AIE_G0029010.mRNA.1.CDS.1 [Saccharomyces cerevisiae]CAI6735628.1 AHL_G0029030.mRNA.1.CDS.1 [Saccharomyces cerevisiae]
MATVHQKNMSTLKQRKEDFVTGLNGGSITEINAVTSIALVTYISWNLLKNSNLMPPGISSVQYIIDFALNWVALLLSITIYASEPYLLNTLILLPCLLAFIYGKFTSSSKPSNPIYNKKKMITQRFQLEKKPYITAYRGGMLILTAIAILAVDFPIFPRRFAKVETWGTSLMDLGVGSFVFSNGIVSSRALLKNLSLKSKPSFLKNAFNALKSGGTLLFLGLLRLFFVKNLEYQEHVTEYGVHWNFFITLSLLPLVLTFIDPVTRMVPRCSIAIFISCIYEWLLLKDDRTLNFLILADRNCFFSANREGIFSFLGYCSIFLWGQNTGFYLLGNKPTLNNLYKPSTQDVVAASKKSSTWDYWTSVTPLTGLCIWSTIFLVISQLVFQYHPYSVSRRFANLPYTLWVITYNLLFLTGYCLTDKIFGNSSEYYKVAECLESINSNGLFLFLLANVSTGLVNMSMVTIDSSPLKSFLVFLAYCSFIAVISVFLYRKRIFIKL